MAWPVAASHRRAVWSSEAVTMRAPSGRKDRSEMIALHGHQGRVWSASFSPDGARIVTASEDCTARIWDATAAREINAVRGHQDWV